MPALSNRCVNKIINTSLDSTNLTIENLCLSLEKPVRLCVDERNPVIGISPHKSPQAVTWLIWTQVMIGKRETVLCFAAISLLDKSLPKLRGGHLF